MRDLQHVRILEEICDIVADDMNARKIELTERSFLLNEIAEVEPLERRELLRNHLFSTVLNLLIGVQDQVRSLGAAFNVGASVTPFIPERTILEYSYKITYISDPQISPSITTTLPQSGSVLAGNRFMEGKATKLSSAWAGSHEEVLKVPFLRSVIVILMDCY